MSETASIRIMPAGADVATAVAKLLGIAGTALRDDPNSTRTYLVRAISLLDAQASDQVSMKPRGGLTAWQIRRVNEYIDRHIGAAIRTSQLARVVDFSTSHFSRAFKQSLGQTAKSYIAHRRVDLARQLMLTTDTPLSQIALDCGLCDQSHLTRVFRRYVGTSPRVWRRKHATGPDSALKRSSLTTATPARHRNEVRIQEMPASPR